MPLGEEQLNPEELTQVIAEIQEFSSRYSGPLPPPELFAQYKEIYPEAVDWILKAATKEQENRHWCDREPFRRAAQAQLFAFIIAVLGIVVGGTLLFFDKSAAGLATILVPLASVLGIFIYRETKGTHQKGERQNPPS